MQGNNNNNKQIDKRIEIENSFTSETQTIIDDNMNNNTNELHIIYSKREIYLTMIIQL